MEALITALWLHSFLPQKVGSQPVHMHNFLHCHLLINSFNVVVTCILNENKKHLSATEKNIRKGICGMDVLYMGYLFSEILIEVSKSALEYYQKLQVYVCFFLIKASRIKKKITIIPSSLLLPSPIKTNGKKTQQKEGKRKKEKGKGLHISRSISSHKETNHELRNYLRERRGR